MISAALVAALVGYGSTVALLLLAAPAVEATPGKTASRVLAVSLAKAAGSVGPSLATRVPVVLAWSTPDAAMIAAASGVTMAGAVAAFVLAGGGDRADQGGVALGPGGRADPQRCGGGDADRGAAAILSESR